MIAFLTNNLQHSFTLPTIVQCMQYWILGEACGSEAGGSSSGNMNLIRLVSGPICDNIISRGRIFKFPGLSTWVHIGSSTISPKLDLESQNVAQHDETNPSTL